MSTAEVATITPDELLTLPDSARFELVRGQLVERTMSQQSGWIAATLIGLLRMYLLKQPIGDVFSESSSYRCFPHDPGMVRRPDVSLILRGRLPRDQFLRGHVSVAPDLAVEITSPNDLMDSVAEKLEDYFQAGIPLVWQINPSTRTVTVYVRGGEQTRYLHETDELTGSDVLPGFACRVSELFPLLDEVAPETASE